ncbi:CBS domain-containing protein [Schleiferia thermophila]|jgi:CBS domain-containing protein|uniref:CBS domain protein n=1 Tax=Schleiferia thermophila TaxID=884107 RepID=A0A369A782_9FLAO|nr:CBS domain-containing protein [Schleiferia thermophila]KFD38199.1 hypothetical protein AT05_11325 [Schleiferia thermophila str. Yellowstone]RCX05139.1 CBS domain protein [Schleiferia thermophila]GCD79344.1 hypothetical protein JCM30197_05910 [Schleiferia thermophila]
MNLNIPVRAIMTSQVHTIEVNQHLAEAERIIKKHKIRHLPVVEKGKIVGMLSLTDLLRVSFADAVTGNEFNPEVYDLFTIDQLMSRQLLTLRPEDTVKIAGEIFVKNQVHALPVVDDSGKVVGILTTTDLIKFLLLQDSDRR